MEWLFKGFEYGWLPTLVIFAYLVITKILDNKKEREANKKTIKVNAEFLDTVNKLNSFLTYITKDIIEKEDDRCVSSIRTAFKGMAYAIVKFSTFTIIANNVTHNRANIVDNIKHTVYGEFASLYNELILYSNENKHVVDYINIEWKDNIVEDIINIIFDESATKEQRIYNIHNKVTIRTTDFINEVTNKYLKDDKHC
jgi:hypothetical protein